MDDTLSRSERRHLTCRTRMSPRGPRLRALNPQLNPVKQTPGSAKVRDILLSPHGARGTHAD